MSEPVMVAARGDVITQFGRYERPALLLRWRLGGWFVSGAATRGFPAERFTVVGWTVFLCLLSFTSR